MSKYAYLLDDAENLNTENFQFKDYVSASQLKGFKCPTRWADNILNPSTNSNNAPIAFGDMMHVVFEKISNLAVSKYNCYTGKIPFEVVEEVFENTITLYPILLDPTWITRGKKQLKFWHEQEQSREARIFICDDGKPGVELSFYCYLKSGVVVRGIVDRIETNKYTKDDEVDFVDWKTGFLKDDHTLAMTLYKIAGQQVLTKNKIVKTKIVELEREYFEYYNITQSNIDEYNEFIVLTKQTMENFSSAILTIIDKKDWDGLYNFLFDHAVFNKWCYTCRLSSVCKVYINNIYGYVPGLANTDEMSKEETISYLVDQVEHLKLVAKSIKKMLDSIDARILNELSINAFQPISIDEDKKVELTQSSRRHIMESISIPILLKRQYIDLLTIGMANYDTVMAELSEQLESCPEDKKEELQRDIDLLNASVHVVKGKDSWKLSKVKKPKSIKKK